MTRTQILSKIEDLEREMLYTDCHDSYFEYKAQKEELEKQL